MGCPYFIFHSIYIVKMARCRPFTGKRKWGDDPETWMQCNFDPDFELSSYGNVKQKLASTFLYRDERGTQSPRIKIRGKNYQLSRLIATHFVPNPHNHPHVHFINGDNTDCRTTNLTWKPQRFGFINEQTSSPSKTKMIVKKDAVTNEVIQFYNSLSSAALIHNMLPETLLDYIALKSPINGCIFDYDQSEEYTGESWIPCLEPSLSKCEVSTLARIRKATNIYTMYDGQDEYTRVNINKKTYLLHRLIARSFHPNTYKEGLVVNHIDGNKRNNRPENLEWVTQSENMEKAYDRKNPSKAKARAPAIWI